MSKTVLFLSTFVFVYGCCSGPNCLLGFKNGASIAEASDVYATVSFEKPHSQEALDYLGLAGDKKTFTLEEIKAPVLVVEVFGLSCHYCQRAVKHFNDLFELVQERGLSEKIKIIGIGIQSSNFEVEAYRKKFGVRFPLIAAPGNEAYRIMGGGGEIPHVLVLRRDDYDKFIAVYSKPREMRQGRDVLETILSATGLSAERK